MSIAKAIGGRLWRHQHCGRAHHRRLLALRHAPWAPQLWSAAGGLCREADGNGMVSSGNFSQFATENGTLTVDFPIFSGWWWLEPWNLDWLSRNSWEFHHPNWRTPSFFRGVGLNHQPVFLLKMVIFHGVVYQRSNTVTRCHHPIIHGGHWGIPPNNKPLSGMVYYWVYYIIKVMRSRC